MQRRSLNFAALLICSARELIPITYICGIIRYFHPHVNHNAHLNYSLNYILFMSVFPPCHWKKLEEAELSDRQRCTAPRKASEAFIFNTRAGRLRVSGVYASLKHTHTHTYIQSLIIHSLSRKDLLVFSYVKCFSVMSGRIYQATLVYVSGTKEIVSFMTYKNINILLCLPSEEKPKHYKAVLQKILP